MPAYINDGETKQVQAFEDIGLLHYSRALTTSACGFAISSEKNTERRYHRAAEGQWQRYVPDKHI